MYMKYRTFLLLGIIVGSTDVIAASLPLLPRDITAAAAPALPVKDSEHGRQNLASFSRTDEDVAVPSPEVGNIFTRDQEATVPSPRDVGNIYQREDEEVDGITRRDIFPSIVSTDSRGTSSRT
jgi:hypothetical protein